MDNHRSEHLSTISPPIKQFHPFTDNHGHDCTLEVDPDAPLFQALRVAHPGCAVSATVSADLDAFFCAHCHHNGRISGAWAVEIWRETQGVLGLHTPRSEQMVDEEATDYDDPAADDVLVDVQVCGYCFGLLYPEGPDDYYYHPDVFWPCPTARAAGVIPQGEPE